MKKILMLAIILLTLLPMTEVKAQGYSSETSNTACTSQSTGIWCRAMESNADIYTEVYQASYEFDDYSDHGNFSQDVVYQDGVCFHYNYDHNGSNYYTYRDLPYSYDDRESAYFYGSNSYGGYNSGYNNNNYYGSSDSYNSGSGVMYAGSPKNTDEVIGRGERYWEDTNNLYSLYGLRYSSNVNTLRNLPLEFYEQIGAEDCTIRGIATAMWLASGDEDDYNLTYDYAQMVAKSNNLKVQDFGVYNSQFMSSFGDVFNITEYNVGGYTHGTVQNLIDQNTSVLAIVYTDQYYWKGIPYAVSNIELTHMVTIVGYDNDYYYCAYGGKDAVRIPKSAIEGHSIYTCGGLNYEALKRLQNK